jgi:EpsI family protein
MTWKLGPLEIAGIGVLILQAGASQILHREPYLPQPQMLAGMNNVVGDWQAVTDGTVEPDVRDMLGADDLLVRRFQNSDRTRASELFVAYYRTQLRSKNSHDPKVCLPGSGWNPRESRVMRLPVNGREIPVNYYRIAKGRSEAIVLYWFQTHNSVYTYEQELRLHRIIDAMYDNRTDMALVRITMPVGPDGLPAADEAAKSLAPVVYTEMLRYFPPKEKSGS